MSMLEIVLVTGTGTEVGKTWTAVALIRALKTRGVPVAARKPVQSFDPAEGPPDATVLAHASGEDGSIVCPPERTYEVPLAPPIAAAELGRPPFTVAQLRSEIGLPSQGVCVVEGAGGVRSPLASDGDAIDLADLLGATSVILVADAGLGAINAVRLGCEALAPRPTIVFLNRFAAGDRTHEGNRAWLRRDGLDIVTTVEELTARVGQGFPVG